MVLDLLQWWAVLLLPSTGLMLGNATSMTLGMFVASVLVLLVELARMRRLKWRAGRLRVGTVALVFIILHAFVLTLVWWQVDWGRLLGSLFVSVLVLWAAACIRNRLLHYSDDRILRIIGWTTVLLGALAMRSMFGLPVFPPITHPRPVVVFIEPSHFALAFIPFSGFFIVYWRGLRRWAMIIGTLVLALLLQSTTLIAGMLLLLLTCLEVWRFCLFLLICAIAALAANFDASYFIDRIVFSEDLQNLSNVVLLHGWERALLSIRDTCGLGLGFQQFGIWGPIGELQDLILAMAGGDLNLNDGGTTASKLVAEFGVIGIALLVGWFIWWWRAARLLRSTIRGVRQPAIIVFMSVCIVAIGVELFVRGVGYISPGLFLFGFAFVSKPFRITPVWNRRYVRYRQFHIINPAIN
jgi:hypothetical protein